MRTHLFSDLPNAVNELNKDWRSVLISMILVTMAYSLQTHSCTRADTQHKMLISLTIIEQEHTTITYSISYDGSDYRKL